MNLSSNIKDKLSTFFGLLAFIAGTIITVGQSGVVIPAWLSTAANITATVSVLVIGYLTGKTPGANAKTTDQVVEQNKPNP